MRLGIERALLVPAAAVVAVAIGGGAASVASSATGVRIQTIVGTGAEGSTGDGGQGREARVSHPWGVFAMRSGGVVWAEPDAQTVRMVGPDGIVVTIAGTSGLGGSSGDGGPARKARVRSPHAVVPTSNGGFLIADTANNRIRMIDPKGVIHTVAGTGVAGYGGDGAAATRARLNGPAGVSPLAGGGFLIADTRNNVIRRVSSDGTITTVAGTGRKGFSGDGGKATSARLAFPAAVAATADGGFLVVDVGNQRIRKVTPDGTITTVAGNGTRGFAGDGGPATSAALADPSGVAVVAGGGFLIADSSNQRVRRVGPDGTISTVAGTGTAGFSGDGGSATSAQLSSPAGAGVTSTGAILVADTNNNRIRFVGAPTRPASVARPVIFGETGRGETVLAWPGRWKGTGPAMNYRWQLCVPGKVRCATIAGATGKTYRVRAKDFGSTLRVAVTATNGAGSATASSEPVGVGRIVRQLFIPRLGSDDGEVRGVTRAGSRARVSVFPSAQSIEVVRSRLGAATWQASLGIVSFDTSIFGKSFRPESVALVLDVIRARSDDSARLVVHACPEVRSVASSAFRPFAPRGNVGGVSIKKIRRGITPIALSTTATLAPKGPTNLCLFVSGRVPRGHSSVSFASRELFTQKAPTLVVSYRVP